MLTLSEIDKAKLYRKIADRYCDYYLSGITVTDLNGEKSNDPLGEFSACSEEALVNRIELTYGKSQILQEALSQARDEGSWVTDYICRWLRALKFQLIMHPNGEWWVEPVSQKLRDFRIPVEQVKKDGVTYFQTKRLHFGGVNEVGSIISDFLDDRQVYIGKEACPFCTLLLNHSESIHWRIVEFYIE